MTLRSTVGTVSALDLAPIVTTTSAEPATQSLPEVFDATTIIYAHAISSSAVKKWHPR
jgi:hypothetical protein